MDWVEPYRLLDQCYPDLPLHESYVKLLHDAGAKLPTELLEVVNSALPHLRKQVREFLDTLVNPCSDKTLAFISQFLSIVLKTAGTLCSKPEVQNLAAIASSIGAMADNSTTLIKNMNGIGIVGQSMLDRSEDYGRWMRGIGVARGASHIAT